MKAQGLGVWGEGKGAVFVLSKISKGNLASHIRRPIQQYNIYNHSSIAICAATTKIPHLLYEEVLLKTPRLMNDFIYKYDLFTMNMMGMGEKPRNMYKSKKQRKNPPFGCPPIPPSIKLEADCFPGRKNRKQAGPALGGTGILIYRGKGNKG